MNFRNCLVKQLVQLESGPKTWLASYQCAQLIERQISYQKKKIFFVFLILKGINHKELQGV